MGQYSSTKATRLKSTTSSKQITTKNCCNLCYSLTDYKCDLDKDYEFFSGKRAIQDDIKENTKENDFLNDKNDILDTWTSPESQCEYNYPRPRRPSLLTTGQMVKNSKSPPPVEKALPESTISSKSDFTFSIRFVENNSSKPFVLDSNNNHSEESFSLTSSLATENSSVPLQNNSLSFPNPFFYSSHTSISSSPPSSDSVSEDNTPGMPPPHSPFDALLSEEACRPLVYKDIDTSKDTIFNSFVKDSSDVLFKKDKENKNKEDNNNNNSNNSNNSSDNNNSNNNNNNNNNFKGISNKKKENIEKSFLDEDNIIFYSSNVSLFELVPSSLSSSQSPSPLSPPLPLSSHPSSPLSLSPFPSSVVSPSQKEFVQRGVGEFRLDKGKEEEGSVRALLRLESNHNIALNCRLNKDCMIKSTGDKHVTFAAVNTVDSIFLVRFSTKDEAIAFINSVNQSIMNKDSVENKN